jgi:dsRNA-specific ribonuclease
MDADLTALIGRRLDQRGEPVPRKKRMINEKVEELSSYDFEGTFEDIEKKLQEIRDRHPGYESFRLDLDYEYEPYSDGERNAKFVIYGTRPETSQDRRSAAAKQRQAQAAAKALRKAQFEKLKEEFGE